MNKIKEYTNKIFEDIKHIDENGNEYWYARELMPLLEYSLWQRFSNVLRKALSSHSCMHYYNFDTVYTKKSTSISRCALYLNI